MHSDIYIEQHQFSDVNSSGRWNIDFFFFFLNSKRQNWIYFLAAVTIYFNLAFYYGITRHGSVESPFCPFKLNCPCNVSPELEASHWRIGIFDGLKSQSFKMKKKKTHCRSLTRSLSSLHVEKQQALYKKESNLVATLQT